MRNASKTKRRPVVGDVMRMESFQDRNVVAHFSIMSPTQGPFVTVYEGPEDQRAGSLEGYEKLFGPIGCGVYPPVRLGTWTVVGHVEPTETRLPMFLMMGVGRPPDIPPVWWLFDGVRERPLGRDVPDDLKDMELLGVLSWELVEDRIRAGINEFGYEAMMKPYRMGA